jgi:hypothetical protein
MWFNVLQICLKIFVRKILLTNKHIGGEIPIRPLYKHVALIMMRL